MSRSIVFLQPYIPSYRVPLFSAVRDRLAAQGIDMKVAAARPVGDQAARRDDAEVDWAVRVHEWRLPGPLPLRIKALPRRLVSEPDLVIGELASGALESSALALLGKRFAVWGHGYAAVSKERRLDGWLEAIQMRHAKRVFVYTDGGRFAAMNVGVPHEDITVLYNSVDTKGLRSAVSRVDRHALLNYRRRLGLGSGPVVAFIGGLDESKRIHFLLESASALRCQLAGLSLLIAGDGVQRTTVERFCSENRWAVYLGRVDQEEKALISGTASLLLNPGRVGLIALDSFAMGVPIATTNWPFHAPEYEYLDDSNAVITRDSVDAYVHGILEVITCEGRLDALTTACGRGGERYTIEGMADRFVAGIAKSLG